MTLFLRRFICFPLTNFVLFIIGRFGERRREVETTRLRSQHPRSKGGVIFEFLFLMEFAMTFILNFFTSPFVRSYIRPEILFPILVHRLFHKLFHSFVYVNVLNHFWDFF
jgi:hypothetical protein